MNWIVIGCTAFILLTLFDLNKIYKWHSLINVLFPISLILLIISLYMIYIQQDLYGSFTAYPFFYTLVIIGFIEQIYALFFALPASDTYTKLNEIQLVDHGLYSLCRHPGVWGFLLMAIGFAFGSGSLLISVTAIIWSIFDLIHVYIQDKIIFPKSIPGYLDYQEKVPFLFLKLKESRSCQNPS